MLTTPRIALAPDVPQHQQALVETVQAAEVVPSAGLVEEGQEHGHHEHEGQHDGGPFGHETQRQPGEADEEREHGRVEGERPDRPCRSGDDHHREPDEPEDLGAGVQPVHEARSRGAPLGQESPAVTGPKDELSSPR